MITTTISCDVCGYKFTSPEPWDTQPCRVELKLQSPPRQEYESAKYDHVCYACVATIKEAFYDAVKQMKQKGKS